MSYSFPEKLQQERHWFRRYATQSEILRHANYVTDKSDLCRSIQFGTRVTIGPYDEKAGFDAIAVVLRKIDSPAVMA